MDEDEHQRIPNVVNNGIKNYHYFYCMAQNDAQKHYLRIKIMV